MSYNPAILDGTVYLAGREDLDGSLRFSLDVDTGFTEIQKRIQGVWQPADFETGPRSLWVGRNIGVAGLGDHLVTETLDGMLHFHAHSHFDGEVSTSDTLAIRATSYLSDVPIQPDESGEWTGASLEFPLTPANRSLLDKLSVKTGATAARDIVRVQVWKGTDDTGTLIFDQNYPVSEFTANTVVPLVLDGDLEFEAGVTTFWRYSSPQPFSLRANAALTTPWAQISYSVIVTDNMLQTAEWVDGTTWADGDHFIDSRKIYVSNVAGTQPGTFAANAAKWNSLGNISRFSRNALTTGLVTGGLITPTSGTTLDISAGEGFVADYSDPQRPLPTLVAWNTITGYTPANIGTDGQYIFGINVSGTLIEIEVTALTAQDIRDYIFVGGVGIQSGAISAIITAPLNVGVNGINTAKDFIRDVIGPANIVGNDIAANGANLSLNNSGGAIFIGGANFRNNPEVPDEVMVAPAAPMTFLRFFRAPAPSEDVIIDPVGPTTVIDPTRYDDGSGTLATVTGNRYSVQVVYVGPDGNYYVAYGQELFNKAAAAEEAVHNGTLLYDEHPTPQKFVRRAFVIAQNSTTDLTTATFLMDGKFRAGGILTGAIEIHSSLRNLEWNVSGHVFEEAGTVDIGDYEFVTANSARVESLIVKSSGDAPTIDFQDSTGASQGRIRGYSNAIEITSPNGAETHFKVDTGSGETFCYDDLRVSADLYGDYLYLTGDIEAVNTMLTGDLEAINVVVSGYLGIETSGVPHAGIGMAKFAINGANAHENGPHVQFTTVADDYPLLQVRNWQHDDISLSFDAYYDNVTGWMSSNLGSCFQIQKNDDKFKIRLALGITPGTAIGNWWNDTLVITSNGIVDAPLGLQSGGEDVLVTETDPIFTAWDKSTGISITTSQVTDHSYWGADLLGFTVGEIAYGNSIGNGLASSSNLTYSGGVVRVVGTVKPDLIQYPNTTGQKLNLYSTTYSLGVESDELRIASNGMIRLYTDGYAGTELARFEAGGMLKVVGGVRAPEFWSTGLLKIQPDVQGDVELFGDTDVDDAVNGKMLYVRRQAVEGDSFIRLYVSHAMTGVISASSDLTAYAEGSITLQSAAENIICRMGDDAGAKGTYFKNNSNAIVGSVDSLGNAQFNVSMNVPEISNTNGLLKIQPDVQGDVELFGDTDVGNDDNSKVLKVWRRAPEGNDYIRMYVTAGRACMIHASNNLTMQGQVTFTINSVTQDIVLKTGDNAGVRKVYFRDSDNVDVASVDSDGKAWFRARLEAQKLFVHQDTEVLAQFTRNSDSESGTVAAGILMGVRSAPDGETIQNKGAVLFVRTASYGRGDLVLCVNTAANNDNASLSDEVLRLAGDGNATFVNNVTVPGLINGGVARYSRGGTQPYHYNSWDCTTARYKQTFGLSTWGTGPHDSAWSPDGKKVFVVDNTSEEINEFAVSTPWDVSTMTWTSVKNVSSEESNPQSLCFNLDGTKMFITGAGGDEVNMYTLSTAWTLSTATPTNLKDLSGSSETPMGIRFKPDGFKMFISDGSLDEVQAWTLSTAWDVTTAAYTTKFDASMDTIEGFSFSPDGRRLYVVDGSAEDDIHEYELGTPWDITTGVHTRSLDLTNTATMPNSVTFSPDGRKMYVTDNGGAVDGLLEFDMGFRCEGLIHTEQLVIGEPTQITPWLLPLEVVSADNVQGNFHDSRAQAAGTGGGFAFTGLYTDAGDLSFCAEFGAEKVNSTSGDYGFDFVLKTQRNGGSLTEVLRCHSTGETTLSGGLKLDSVIGAFQTNRMTTTQRNALTPVNGMVIYNTTAGAFNFREAGAWVTK